MLGIQENIKIIEDLIAEDTPQSIVYAALECRLTIEQLCYQRLRLAHDYISHADVKKWQPKDVVKTLIQEVDANLTEGLTVSVSEKSSDYYRSNPEEEIQYVDIGTQVGFSANKMGKLWNALSNLALHVPIPKDKHENISKYTNSEKTKRKINECLSEFRSLSETTLIVSGFGPDVSFDCLGCESINKRKFDMLDDGQIVNCIDPKCDESYFVRKNAETAVFERRKADFLCACGHSFAKSHNYLGRLKITDTREVDCPECGLRITVGWRLYKLKVEET